MKGQWKDLSRPRPDWSKRAGCSGGRPSTHLKAGVTERGRRGSGGVAAAQRARANRSALRQRPITSRVSRQICPAVWGGAAGSPGAAGYTSERLLEATGQWNLCRGAGGGRAGRPSLCASPVIDLKRKSG